MNGDNKLNYKIVSLVDSCTAHVAFYKFLHDAMCGINNSLLGHKHITKTHRSYPENNNNRTSIAIHQWHNKMLLILPWQRPF